MTVIQTSSARSSGSGKSSSSGSRNSVIRFGIGDPVRAPLGPGHALVQAVERVVGAELVLAPLVRRRIVGDDDGDLVEGRRERHRDRRERASTSASNGRWRRGRGAGGSGAASAFGHGARILGAWTADAAVPIGPRDPTASSSSWTRATGSTSSTGAARWPRPAPGVLLIHGLSNTAWSWAPVARRLRGARHGRRDGPARPRPVGRPDRGATTPALLAEDVVAVAEGSGLLVAALGRPGRPGRPRVRGDRGGVGRRGARRSLRRARPRRRRLGAPRGRDGDGRRRVPARPRRAARGHALARRVPGRSGRPSIRRPGTRTRIAAARATVVETHAGQVVPGDPAACARGLRPDDVRVRPGGDARGDRRAGRRAVAAAPRRRDRVAGTRARRGRRGPGRPPAAGRSAPCRSGETGTT